MENSTAATGMMVSVDQFSLLRAGGFVLSWGVMMAAMMLPSASPMIALYSGLQRNSSKSGQKNLPTLAFGLVYLATWLVLGLPVYLASQAITGLISATPALAGWLPYALALVLSGAGAYQVSPLKRVCLRACRSPLAFLMGHWHPGYAGTLKLALEHAWYCAGCCWTLMVVLVAAGAMSLPWVFLIAALVGAEKLLPKGEWTARVSGVFLILLGLLVAFEPGLAGFLRSAAPQM